MVSTIHAICTEVDHLPSLMGILDECWSDRIQLAQNRDALGIHLSAIANHSQKAVCLPYIVVCTSAPLMCGPGLFFQPFKDQLTSCLLEKIARLQKEHHLPVSVITIVFRASTHSQVHVSAHVPHFKGSMQQLLYKCMENMSQVYYKRPCGP